MKKILTILGLLVIQTMGLLFAAEPAQRIIGGEKVGTSGYEFFVSLMYKYEWDGPAAGHSWNPFCGASYIGGDLLLTAAHCLNSIPRGTTIGVLPGNRTGEFQYEYCANENVFPYQCVGLSSPDIEVSAYHYTGYLIYTGSESDVIPVTKRTETVAIHGSYNSTSLRNDIALIRLASPLPYPSIKLTDNSFPQLPSMATVIGHGNTRFSLSFKGGRPEAKLQEVELPLVSDTQCQTVYGDLHFPSMICAGYKKGRDEEGVKKDSCQGDSGGPMFIDSDEGYELVGVVSYGDDCAVTYGVYTDVVNYRGWVAKKASQDPWENAGGGFPLSGVLLVLVLALLRKGFVARVGLLAIVMSLIGCSFPIVKSRSAEVVFNPVFNSDGIEFSVLSTGCTQEEHIYLRVKDDIIEVRRIQEDMCRMAPHLVRFVMPLPEGEVVWGLKNPVRYSNRVGEYQ